MSQTHVRPDRGWITGAPRWVKIFGIIAIVVVVLVVIILVTGVGGPGGHGPGRHISSGESGSDIPPIEYRAQ